MEWRCPRCNSNDLALEVSNFNEDNIMETLECEECHAKIRAWYELTEMDLYEEA